MQENPAVISASRDTMDVHKTAVFYLLEGGNKHRFFQHDINYMAYEVILRKRVSHNKDTFLCTLLKMCHDTQHMTMTNKVSKV
jgi:hypothetical protein